MRSTVLTPPPTPVEPVTEVLHGIEVTDPYRWLEDQNSPQTREWINGQMEYTRALLDSIPGKEHIRQRVQQLLTVDVVSNIWKSDSGYFFLKRDSTKDQAVIAMREGASSHDITLIDPALWGMGNNLSVDILSVAKDGRLIAYEVRDGGADPCAIEFFDVLQRKTLLDRLPRGFCRGLTFSPDGRGCYYSHEECDVASPKCRIVYWHRFGTPRAKDDEVFVTAGGSGIRLGLLSSLSGTLLAFPVYHIADPITIDVYIRNLPHDGSVRKIISDIGGLFSPFFLGNDLLALTDSQAPNYRVVAIDTDSRQHTVWREVVPESASRIQDLAVVGGQLFVAYLEDMTTRVAAFDLNGQKQMLDCPSDGTIRLLNWQPESDTLFYKFTSFCQPPIIYSYDTRTKEQKVFAQVRLPLHASSFHVKRASYPSTDGTQVPMFLVALKDSRPEPRPTFLTAYGGFGTSATPQFAAHTTFLIEHGFLVAVANLRGGSELGAQWHDAGKRRNRQRAIDDFIAAADWLVAQRLALPGKIAIGGGSNAGLLVAAALTQRPGLFRVVVSLGPLLDMLRYHKFNDAATYLDEYGICDNLDDFPSLLAYSPYHNVKDGTSYPAVLFVSGDADTRCNPMHVRKMTARLQTATSSGYPILLDYKQTWGHMPVQPLNTRIGALTDRLAFICDALGVDT
jgi:prolyl oligopeptidase